jgi:hypothetical protein
MAKGSEPFAFCTVPLTEAVAPDTIIALGSIARDKSSGHAIRDGGSRGIERKIGILRNAEGHDIGPV